MAELDIVHETPLTLAEVKAKLETLKAEKELGFRSQRTLDYANAFTTLAPKDVDSIRTKLQSLDITRRLKDHHIAKLIDIHPKDPDSVKALFATDAVTLKQDEIQKILDALQ